MLYWFFRHLPFNRLNQKGCSHAWTLVELLLILSILGTLTAIAVPVYNNYMDKVNVNRALTDIREIESKIVAYQVEHGNPPDTLDQVGLNNPLDPWGKPYEYLRILGVDKNKIKGKWRKDRFMVPINSDFDLYSMGKDGKSTSPLTAKASRDDIVRANNGGYVGPASEF